MGLEPASRHMQEHLNAMGAPQWPEFCADTPWPPFSLEHVSNNAMKSLAGNATRLWFGDGDKT